MHFMPYHTTTKQTQPKLLLTFWATTEAKLCMGQPRLMSCIGREICTLLLPFIIPTGYSDENACEWLISGLNTFIQAAKYAFYMQMHSSPCSSPTQPTPLIWCALYSMVVALKVKQYQGENTWLPGGLL